MDAARVSAALRDLAAEHAGILPSDTERLRAVLDDIEAALAAGASLAAVLETLHGQGFTLPLSGFESTLRRLRNERLSNQRVDSM